MRFILLLVFACLGIIPSGTVAGWGKYSGGRQGYSSSGVRASRNAYPSRYTGNRSGGYASSVAGYTGGGGYGRPSTYGGYQGRTYGGQIGLSPYGGSRHG